MKVRITVTAVREINVTPSDYLKENDEPMTEEEAIEYDKTSIAEDPFSFIDSEDCVLTVNIERLS